MADVAKYHPINGRTLASDLQSVISMVKTRRTVAFAYVCMSAFVLFTLFLAFNPSPNSSPWFSNIFSSGTAASSAPDPGSADGSHFSSVFSHFFPNASSDQQARNFTPAPSDLAGSSNSSVQSPNTVTAPTPIVQNTNSSDQVVVLKQNQTIPVASDVNNQPSDARNDTTIAAPFTPAVGKQTQSSPPAKTATNSNGTVQQSSISVPPAKSDNTNSTVKSEVGSSSNSNPPAQSETTNSTVKAEDGPSPAPPAQSVTTNGTVTQEQGPIPSAQSGPMNSTDKIDKSVAGASGSPVTAPAKKQSSGSDSSVESLMNCDMFDGDWVKDDSYPLYKPGSCSLIDQQFSCISNGRPDKDYLKYKWKPNGCTLPRLDANHLLQMLKGKRLVFVGDSLNRNMWESMVCILRSAVKDRSKVFEAHGRHHFRGEAEYSFVFKDYNFTVEFYVSPFLVQEWEIKDKNGTAKERLRLDLIGKTCDDYKGADILIFNTGHWWTHEKTSLGKDYYQEGSHVYGQLNVLEAFHKALTTWARWVDANVDPKKSIVFFRGYSASHFSGGQWNSGGACDNEIEPIKNHTYLTRYPPKMKVLEEVLNGMKTHVSYLNITRLTDYRKDGHPSIYRKKNIPEAERRSPMRYQDCSHWCLPGVPDAWNELLYAELLVREHQKQQQK